MENLTQVDGWWADEAPFVSEEKFYIGLLVSTSSFPFSALHLEPSFLRCSIRWDSSLLRDGGIYLASSSSRFTIRKRPAVDRWLLENCTVPQRRQKHHINAVVPARGLRISNLKTAATRSPFTVDYHLAEAVRSNGAVLDFGALVHRPGIVHPL